MHLVPSPEVPVVTLFERVGGMPFFAELTRRFYEQVALDPVLRPLYPADLGPAEDRLRLFLAQYWGGPTTYSELRGHPRLRMRHAPYLIASAEQRAWLSAMVGALDGMAVADDDRAELVAYFEMAATHLRNAPDH